MLGRASYGAYRLAAGAVRALPEPIALTAAATGGRLAARLLGNRARVALRHQRRARGVPLSPAEARAALGDAVASYARYWVESFRLPTTPPARMDARFSIDGLDHIRRAMASGTGPILAIPHLGGWDVGGSWLVRQGIALAVVVEALEPPELFDWFVEQRSSQGLEVIPLGPGAASRVLKVLGQARPVALLCDRDLDGRGVEVEFFGERTTLPAGPAMLALRSGAPILPTAVYFKGRGHHAVVRPALPATRRGRLSEDVARLTQDLAGSLEELIAEAPEQWHLFQPNWPSDRLQGS